MGSRAEFLYQTFLEQFDMAPTECQDRLFREIADFLTTEEGDIMVVNGYAGTGKTSAMAAVIGAMRSFKIPSVLLAPTGRAAKVLSKFAHHRAYTIHKKIYRQKSVGDDGFANFSKVPNEGKGHLFVVDEASLIGIDSNQQSTSLFGSGNLLSDLIDYVRSGVNCRLILIGDSAQLPPVGMDASPALAPEYMDGFGGVRYCTLTSVVRQARESGILFNATRLRTSLESFPEIKLELAGMPDVERVSGDQLIDKISEAYSTYGEDETVVLCRSNKRAIRYNLGIRSTVQYKEEKLLRGDALMIVKNCYQFIPEESKMGYIANGDIARLIRIGSYEERYGLHFAKATLSFPDYDNEEIDARVCLDTLESESAALTYEQQNALYQGVNEDYSHIKSKKKRYESVREDLFYNALQLKYAQAITCHKAQGGQWDCVFIDCPFWMDETTEDDVKWLYTAFTRAVQKVYLVNFPDRYFA